MTLTKAQLQVQRALIERSKRDPAAFGELFDAHYSLILNYVVRRTGDVPTAQDITSTVFMKALDGIRTFTWQGVPFSAWLYRIAGNEIRMYHRRRNNTLSLDEMQEIGNFELADDADVRMEIEEAQAALDRQLDYQAAKNAIACLPIKYQEVLALRFGESKKVTEIATILNKREGTVKSLLFRALARLKTELQSRTAQPFDKKRIMNNEGRQSKIL